MNVRKLTMLAHGEPGSGKSWLANSAPGPRLLFDAEGRAQHLKKMPERTPQRLVWWDPRDQIADESADPEVTTVISVRTWADVEMAMKWLQSGQHPFRSVGVDSITEIQQRLIDDAAGVDQLKHGDWGDVLRRGERFIRDLRDLRDHPTNPVVSLVVIAGTAEKSDKMGPMLQGQLGTKVSHHFDVVGFMQKRKNPETSEKERVLWIDSYVGGIIAKDDTDDLVLHYGDFIVNPNITEMLNVLNPQTNTNTETTEGSN